MKIAFHAKYVQCTDAIGGDLMQVAFDTIPSSQGEDTRQSPCVLISRLFEFPGAASIEWYDGREYDGGAEIVSADLNRSRFLIQLDQGSVIDVSFSVSDQRYVELISFLKPMIGDRLVSCEQVPERSGQGNAGPPFRFVSPDET